MKLLIVSDIHSNYEAIKTINETENYDKMIFLGDAVDYGPQPAEVVDFITENSDYNLMGNHDYAVVYDVDCQCSPAMHDLSEFTRENISKKLLSKEDLDKLKTFQNEMKVEIDGINFYLAHASPYNNLYGYLFSTEAEMVWRDKNLQSFEYIMIGHTHFPMFYKGRIINPGSAGQPRNGNWMPQYAVMDTSNREVTFKRFKYDNQKILELLKSLIGSNEKYYEMLKKYYV